MRSRTRSRPRARPLRGQHRPTRRPAWAFVVLCLGLLAGGGCYWAKYEKLVRTHVDLLLAMSDKIADVSSRDGAPSSLEEYRYPLERARDFARIAARRFEGRPSLVAFRRLCDDYERLLVAAADRSRGGDVTAGRRFADALNDVRASARRVLAVMNEERAA